MYILAKYVWKNIILKTGIFDQRTNNACQSYHHVLNSKFNTKGNNMEIY